MANERDRLRQRDRLLVAIAAAGLMYAVSGSRVGVCSSAQECVQCSGGWAGHRETMLTLIVKEAPATTT